MSPAVSRTTLTGSRRLFIEDSLVTRMSGTLTDEATTTIEDLIYEWLADTGAPGASVAIVDRSEEIYARGFGSRRLETNDPATPDTLYGFASVTKSFTALAVLQQVGEGRIELADPIADHTDADFDGVEDVTIHELLTHTSGVPSLGTSAVLIARQGGLGEAGLPIGDEEDLLHLVDGVGDERDDESIGRFLYNNTAYILLSHAVESASGDGFTEYVEREIFEPLGMERSTFDAEAYGEDPDHATPYRSTDDGFEATEFPARELSYGPGGLIASPRELGRYLRCNLAGGSFEGERLIDESLLSRAHEPHVEPLPRYGDGYGYGWSIREVAGTRVVGHGGSLLTSSAAVGFLPEDGFGIAIGCAGQPELHPTEILEGIVAALQGEPPASAVPTLAYRDRVERFTGTYESYRGVATASVEDSGGYLSVEMATGPIDDEYVLVPEDPTLESTRFRAIAPGRSTPVEFVETDDGIDLFLDRYRLHKTDPSLRSRSV